MLLIQPYNPDWPRCFQDIAGLLREVLPECATEIEHVGSTAVPGLPAKPIIDIDIVFWDFSGFPAITAGLSRLGYYHNGDQGIPGREAFQRREQGGPHPVLDRIQHHLYACHYRGDELQRHLLFRDYLRGHQSARREYAALKQTIAAEAGENHKLYAALKEEQAREFILGIVDLARQAIPGADN
jgi:GrpB-like predicted nucleotidyltransferase (UPF0157 family)